MRTAPVRRVSFRLAYAADAPTVVARGTFAPGITIRAVFDAPSQTASTRSVKAVELAGDR